MTGSAGNTTPTEKIADQSAWYEDRARQNRSYYVTFKGAQIVFAAAIPVVSVASAANIQRWATAILGALVGVIEGLIQLGQYQQNWLLYRATREALNREEYLHSAKAGPYLNVQDPDTLYIERSDAIMSGENARWLSSQQESSAKK